MRWFLRPIAGGVALALLATGAAAHQDAAVQGHPAPAPQSGLAPSSSAPSRPTPSNPLPATAALYQSYTASGKMPGIVGAFGIGNRPTIFVSSGKLSYEAGAAPADADSLWRVYSMTKPVTALAAMILIEDGKLELDEPLGNILPAFRNMTVRLDENSVASRPAAGPITIRHLLTHTAGLGYNIVTRGPLLELYNQKGINPSVINNAAEAEARKTRPASLQEFADRVATLPLVADPGTKWSYSIGLDVLGAVIEKRSGMPFDSFVQKRIFDPLKMRSSYWTVPVGEAGRLATNYMMLGDRHNVLDSASSSAWLSPPSFPYGGAGLVMSARDYDRFLLMLQNEGQVDGVRIMKAKTAKLAMSNLLPAGVEFSMPLLGADGPAGSKLGFGAGGFVVLEDKANPISVGSYGWGGAAGTAAWVNPAKKMRGTIMVNYFPGDKWPVRDETLKALTSDMARYGFNL